MRKLAEVRRNSPDGPVEVLFDPRFAVEQLNERRRRESALPPSAVVSGPPMVMRPMLMRPMAARPVGTSLPRADR
jgi:hypothetical protein